MNALLSRRLLTIHIQSVTPVRSLRPMKARLLPCPYNWILQGTTIALLAMFTFAILVRSFGVALRLSIG